MEDILKFDTISQYNVFNRNETLHPLVSIVNLSKAVPRRLQRMSYGFYVTRWDLNIHSTSPVFSNNM